jgi:ABC-type methionine transport system ATPase subunit
MAKRRRTKIKTKKAKRVTKRRTMRRPTKKSRSKPTQKGTKRILKLFRSNKVLRKVYLTFPRQKTKEAIICDMYDRYRVRFNIRSASVDDQMGLIALEMEAETLDQMAKAFKYFEKRGVKVEPIEMDVIEP